MKAAAAAGKLVRSPRMSGSLVAGAAIMGTVVAFSLVGPLLVDLEKADVGAAEPKMPPSGEHWLGSDVHGRDLFTTLVLGTPETLKIGLIAGAAGTGLGLVLGLLAGYFGGLVDSVIRVISDSLLTVPTLAILIVIAASVSEMSVELMGLTVAALAWMWPTRTIRSQLLSIRERAYVEVARVNGQGELEILFREVMPNLLPYIAASFVGAVGSGILAAIGLEALGLGPNHLFTLGTSIYWSQKFTAVLRGLWWWWAPPIAMIALIFVGLMLLSAGLDRVANPRLRTRT